MILYQFYSHATTITNEALPGVLGNRGTRTIFSGEQRPKNKGNRGTQAILGDKIFSRRTREQELRLRGTHQCFPKSAKVYALVNYKHSPHPNAKGRAGCHL